MVGSPLGGMGAVDPQGYAFYAQDPTTQKYVKNNTVPLTSSTVKLSTLSDAEIDSFDAVFFVGGTGAMWDFPYDVDIQRIVKRMWENNKVVSAVCHGPMGLMNVKLSNGDYLLDGKLMTGFSNDEEDVLGRVNACVFCYLGFEPGCNPQTCDGPSMPVEYYVKRDDKTLPNVTGGKASFLLENGAKERGAKYVSFAQDW